MKDIFKTKEQKQMTEEDYGFLLQVIFADNHLNPESFSRMIKGVLGPRSIYMYMEGRVKPDVWFWRELWKATRDERILKIIIDDDEVLMTHIPEAEGDPDIRTLARIAKEEGEVLAELARIYADGKVDFQDRKQALKFSRAAMTLVRDVLRASAAIGKAAGVDRD